MAFAPEARAARRARRRAGKIASCGQADDARADSGWPLPRVSRLAAGAVAGTLALEARVARRTAVPIDATL
jgi:hypothetical protein